MVWLAQGRRMQRKGLKSSVSLSVALRVEGASCERFSLRYEISGVVSCCCFLSCDQK